jgi:hypothetical protein
VKSWELEGPALGRLAPELINDLFPEKVVKSNRFGLNLIQMSLCSREEKQSGKGSLTVFQQHFSIL